MRLLLAAIAGLVLLLGVQTWRVSSWKGKHETLSAQYQKEKAEAKAAYEKADQEYRASEERHKLELKGIANETQAQIDKAQLDATNARKSSRKLLDAFANSSPCSQATTGTTASVSGEAASAPEDLRTIVFSRIDDSAGIIAEYADKARIAGLACERAYEVNR